MMPFQINEHREYRQFDFAYIQQHQSNFDSSRSQDLSVFYEGKVVCEKTASCQMKSYQDLMMFNLKKTQLRDYQISFEANFLKEHQIAFKKQTENFMESSFKFNKNRTSEIQLIELFKDLILVPSSADQIKFTQIFKQREQFFLLLKNQQKINLFINFLEKNCQRVIAQQFLNLIYIARQNYEDIKQQLYTIDDVLKASSKLTEEKYQQLFNDQRFEYLTMKKIPASQLNSNKMLKESFREYLRFFLSTVFLVSLQYFQNPFIQPANGLRYRSFGLKQNEDDNQREQKGEDLINQPRKKKSS